ncbi:MAG: protein-export chaperone SecB [Alphaproteobacteria bacterium]|nr:protein-export chaperone SecB [Alphaproteobacteria bacterium]
MSKKTKDTTEANVAPVAESAEAGGEPRFNITVQYLKDFSFENPLAPQSLVSQGQAPAITVQVNVEARRLADDAFEVDLFIVAEAKHGEQIAFVVDLKYAGIFAIENIPDEHLSGVLLIECPRYLFPFARSIISNATRDGGFPPLNIQPIDFVALYQSQIAAAAEA